MEPADQQPDDVNIFEMPEYRGPAAMEPADQQPDDSNARFLPGAWQPAAMEPADQQPDDLKEMLFLREKLDGRNGAG